MTKVGTRMQACYKDRYCEKPAAEHRVFGRFYEDRQVFQYS